MSSKNDRGQFDLLLDSLRNLERLVKEGGCQYSTLPPVYNFDVDSPLVSASGLSLVRGENGDRMVLAFLENSIAAFMVHCSWSTVYVEPGALLMVTRPMPIPEGVKVKHPDFELASPRVGVRIGCSPEISDLLVEAGQVGFALCSAGSSGKHSITMVHSSTARVVSRLSQDHGFKGVLVHG